MANAGGTVIETIGWVVLWVAASVLFYLAVGGTIVAALLGYLLRAGNVDWSGARRASPREPTTIGYRGDPREAFGYAFETIRYETELGEAEAWLVPAEEPSSLWAIFLHGIGGIRENGYRQLAILHDAGVPVLMITYRNDRGAPTAPDRFFSFGLEEWRDLGAAIDWARSNGAERLVLVGESMGAAIIGQYLRNVPEAVPIVGLALDAPALDLPAIVRAGAQRLHAPLAGVLVAIGLAIWRLVRPDLRLAVAIDAVVRFRGAVFVAHGADDPLVPVALSDALAAARPGLDFLRAASDVHLGAYDADPEGYRAGLLRLVEELRAVV